MLTPELKVSLGGYYQKGDYNKCMGEDEVDNTGIRARISYEIANGLIAGVNASYDDSFDWRVSADIKYRFGLSGAGAVNNEKMPAPIAEMSSTPANRDIRVHDHTQHWGMPANYPHWHKKPHSKYPNWSQASDGEWTYLSQSGRWCGGGMVKPTAQNSTWDPYSL